MNEVKIGAKMVVALICEHFASHLFLYLSSCLSALKLNATDERSIIRWLIISKVHSG
jgi:hypothetical protein